MEKKKILSLSSVFQFGKYKGETVADVIDGLHNTDKSGINYISWLYSNTNYGFDEKVLSYYSKRTAEIRKIESSYSKNNNRNNVIDSTDRNWEIGKGEMSSWFD